jgi:hypothetical protein
LSPVRGIPTSRAYWDLKAEQVLNRVFEAEKPIEVEVCETPSLFPAPSSIPVELQDQPPSKPSLFLAGASITVVVLAGVLLVALGTWNQSQQAIRQERNMLLIERLRTMGPGTTTSQASEPAQAAAPNGETQAGMPAPPPPGEPWMEELSSLPASSAPPADVLKVPVSSQITSPAPTPTGSDSSKGGSPPQLVGVVQVPGQSGSAIFQLGGSSTSAAVGESIGSSGWRLHSANGDTAVIEKGGEQRQISISSGF